MQQGIWQHYQAVRPGEVMVLGPDELNGQPSQLRQFGNSTGATYPLLLNGHTAVGGDINLLYGQRDNWVVINKTGTVRYTSVAYPYGESYHLDEILGTVDSLVSNPLDVPVAGVGPRGLRAAPSPFRGYTMVELTNPGPTRRARITVHDLQGRRVATLWDSPAPRGATRVTWDGRDERGAAAAPGVYVLHGEIGGVTSTCRVTRLR